MRIATTTMCDNNAMTNSTSPTPYHTSHKCWHWGGQGRVSGGRFREVFHFLLIV